MRPAGGKRAWYNRPSMLGATALVETGVWPSRATRGLARSDRLVLLAGPSRKQQAASVKNI